jgi:hydroxymethylglutaryl-CoA reductase
MIENTVSVLAIPVGVACNFTINGRDVLIPDGDRGAIGRRGGKQRGSDRPHSGRVHTSSTKPIMQAQVQVVDAPDPHAEACRALATEGIQHGHMSLHARNVAVAAGATPDELPRVVDRMVRDGAVGTDYAERILTELRSLRPKVGDAG